MSEDNGSHLRLPDHRVGFITSADVAERAGVSRSAVSRTFTPGASVSPTVKRKVLAAADELGYRVNRLARGLISARSNLVGIVCADLETPFTGRLLSHITTALSQRGMNALVIEFSENEEDLRDAIIRILEYRVESIVMLSGSPSVSIIRECVANGVKPILVNGDTTVSGAFSVASDDFTGAAKAADRLVAAGHRHLAVVASASSTPVQQRRTMGFVKRAETLGLTATITLNGPVSYESGVAGAHALFGTRLDQRPDGVFCTSDVLAAGFMDTLRTTYGLQIPDDVSVIGFDDLPQAAWENYQLTTLRQNPVDMSRAILAAIRNIDGSADRSVVVDVTLVDRESVRA